MWIQCFIITSNVWTMLKHTFSYSHGMVRYAAYGFRHFKRVLP